MTAGKLFLSFWNICLNNLPEGNFRRTRVLPDEAKCSIREAQLAGSLLGVSEDDLLAPYRKRESENHEALCGVLEKHFDISVSLRNSYVEDREDDEALHFTRALDFAEVKQQDRLMVVTCNYILDARDESEDFPRFTIDPDTVEFHVIEAV